MNPMLPAKLAKLALFAALLAPALAWGKASDRNQPMTIDSTNSDCNFSMTAAAVSAATWSSSRARWKSTPTLPT